MGESNDAMSLGWSLPTLSEGVSRLGLKKMVPVEYGTARCLQNGDHFLGGYTGARRFHELHGELLFMLHLVSPAMQC